MIYFLCASFLLSSVLIADEKMGGSQIISSVIYVMTGVDPNHLTDGPEVFTAIWLYTDKEAYCEGEPITLALYNRGRYVAVFDSSYRVAVFDGTYYVYYGLRFPHYRYLFTVRYSDTTILEEGQFTQTIYLDGLPPGKYRISKGVRVGYEPNFNGRETRYDTTITLTSEIPELNHQ